MEDINCESKYTNNILYIKNSLLLYILKFLVDLILLCQHSNIL